MDVMREYWTAQVECARKGNVEAARDVLEDFSKAVEDIAAFKDPANAWSGPIPWQAAEYLASAFRQILHVTRSGTKTKTQAKAQQIMKALNLTGSRGRRKGEATHDLEALAAAYSLLTRNGVTPEAANEKLQKALGADRSTIYRARQENAAFEYWHKSDDGTLKALIDDEVLRVTAKPYVTKLAHIWEAIAQKEANPTAEP